MPDWIAPVAHLHMCPLGNGSNIILAVQCWEVSLWNHVLTACTWVNKPNGQVSQLIIYDYLRRKKMIN